MVVKTKWPNIWKPKTFRTQGWLLSVI